METNTESGTWQSFDERVLLEPMPDSSSSSVNEAMNTGAPDSSQTSGDQNPDRDPEEVGKKKEELHKLVQSQFAHFCERGLPKWQLSNADEQTRRYSELTSYIMQSLEIGDSVSEHQTLIDEIRRNPKT